MSAVSSRTPSLRRIREILWLRIGEARARRDEAKEAFEGCDPSAMEAMYDAWVAGSRDYQVALENYARSARAAEVCDVSAQIALMHEIGVAS